MINIQNLIRDSLKRSWNMFKMLKPWKVMCFTRNCSSLEASKSMGSELTIFLQEGAWEKTHANISSSYEPMIVHESESLFFSSDVFWHILDHDDHGHESCCAQNLAMRKSLRAWVHNVTMAVMSEGSEGCPLTDCSTGRLRRFKRLFDQPCLWKQNCSYKIPP